MIEVKNFKFLNKILFQIGLPVFVCPPWIDPGGTCPFEEPIHSYLALESATKTS